MTLVNGSFTTSATVTLASTVNIRATDGSAKTGLSDSITIVANLPAGTGRAEAQEAAKAAAAREAMELLARIPTVQIIVGGVRATECVVYVDDLYGQSGLRALRYAADRLGFTIAEEQTIARGDQDFAATVSALESKADG